MVVRGLQGLLLLSLLKIGVVGLQRWQKLAHSRYYWLRSSSVALARFGDVFISRLRNALVKFAAVICQNLVLSIPDSEDFRVLSLAKFHVSNLFA